MLMFVSMSLTLCLTLKTFVRLFLLLLLPLFLLFSIRIDSFMTVCTRGDSVCPNAMHGKFGMLSLGKASSHSAALPRSLLLFFLCVVFSCLRTFHCEAYSFTTDGYGIFNMRANLGACYAHEWGSCRHKQVCKRGDSEGQKNCVSPRLARGLNLGSSDLNTNAIYP